jgi:hypothetical protein
VRAVLLCLVVLSACGLTAPADSSRASIGAGPELGKADGSDSADRACGVILRSFERVPVADGFEVDHGFWVWKAVVDVDARMVAERGATVGALYSANGGSWYVFHGVQVTDAPDAAGRVRFEIRVDDRTVPTPAMELRSWEYQRAQLAVYLELPDTGERRFDHNRVTADLGNYELGPSNGFAIGSAPGICPETPPRAELAFRADWSERQTGPIVPHGTLTIDYDLSRLPDCRYSRAGYQLWDVEAWVKFQPMGLLEVRSVTTVAGGARVAVPTTFAVPAGTQYVDVWFRNHEAQQHCEAFDSNEGQNYRFGAIALPAPPAWAGNWGSSVARDCVARPGVPEPMVIDSYVRERACAFVEAEVYVPGLTDTDDRPEWLWAQAVHARDGVEQPPVPLEPLGRVGNNWRYRFTLPYEYRQLGWSTGDYALRFSSDGSSWLTVGQPDGSRWHLVRE